MATRACNLLYYYQNPVEMGSTNARARRRVCRNTHYLSCDTTISSLYLPLLLFGTTDEPFLDYLYIFHF
jgi:hypothetical protein